MSNAPQAPSPAPLWSDMTPGQFDAKAKPVQAALFAEPDRCGTPDMFSDQA